MKRQWRKGPPPEIGWWPASGVQDHTAIRWWDGHMWSCPAIPFDSAEDAASAANKISQFQDRIEWTDRWWL